MSLSRVLVSTPPNQSAAMSTGIRKAALLLPQGAIQELQGTYQVIIVDSSKKCEFRTVEVGDRILLGDREGIEPIRPSDRRRTSESPSGRCG